MSLLSKMPSMEASSLFSIYTSLVGIMMLVRSMANEIIPQQLRTYLYEKFYNILFDSTKSSPRLTLVIDENWGITRNEVFNAASTYLPTKITPSTQRLKAGKTARQKTVTTAMENGEEIIDSFDGIQLKWKLVCAESKGKPKENIYYELSFIKKFKDRVLEAYIPYILSSAKQLRHEEKVIKLYTRHISSREDGGGLWGSIDLEHPARFDTLAMDRALKKMVIDDLDRFLGRKEYYKKVGKVWKRGYLLYGPPGTGKSSLIAAVANYLKFDVYDLELSNIHSNSELRRILVSTTNRSIIVIEDIDCNEQMQDRGHQNWNGLNSERKLTLSGMLNFIDGLWSSCGDERIIIFTTNHKEKLDPALLRPGRMDMHIHMSYCTPQGFKILVSNYLSSQSNNHPLSEEIEGLIEIADVTPAEIAEELMKGDDPDCVLGGLLDFLKHKIEDNKIKAREAKKVQLEKAKEPRPVKSEESEWVQFKI
uniref:AAA ATPase family n=1 Tax=Paeonia suffruticosa TaxID=45171 RepID=A0AB38Z7G6_PAESU